ncbi:MAG TPA: hypothetical protein VEW42_06310 [Candidatus Eisenbacteria bacterium]|nr:hypothetical protein [Candidatus Eisenbacteria bacterium]
MPRKRVPKVDEQSQKAYGLGPRATLKELNAARDKKTGVAIRTVYLLPPTASEEELRDTQAKYAEEGAERMERERI